jgi:hypothetical protein
MFMNSASVYFLYAVHNSDSPHFSGQQICNLMCAEYTPYKKETSYTRFTFTLEFRDDSLGVAARNVNNFKLKNKEIA